MEAECESSLVYKAVLGQLQLHRETLSQTKQRKKGVREEEEKEKKEILEY